MCAIQSIARHSFSLNRQTTLFFRAADMKMPLLAFASCVAAAAAQVSVRKPRVGGKLSARPSCPNVRAPAHTGAHGAPPARCGGPGARRARVEASWQGAACYTRRVGAAARTRDGAGMPCVHALSNASAGLSLGACATDHFPHPPHPQPLFANKTQTLKRAAVGAGDSLLQYVPPLKAGLAAAAAAAGQQLADAPFDPATADWAKIYTGYPQPVTDGTILCLSDFAVCAFANCTVSFQSDPPVAECGCLPIRAAVPGPRKPNGLPVPSPYNQMTIGNILDAKLRAATVKLCGNGTRCLPGAAPFCAELLPSAATGRPTMYGGWFDLISTYSPTAWTTEDTAPGSGQGFPGGAITCDHGGALAECNGAACLNRPAFNGLPVTCYCPVYTPLPGTPFFVAGQGATCSGLPYVQNGGLGSP